MTPHIRVYPAAWASLRALALLTAAVGCGHTDPFTSPPFGSDAPFDPTPPVRLTFNSLADRGAAWLPDGSGILYSAQQLGRADHDLCLALLPPGGGRQRELACDPPSGGENSTDAIESPSPVQDGRLAFVEANSSIGAPGTLTTAIEIAPTLDPKGASKVQSIPYTIDGEPTHTYASALRWLGAERLGFVGGTVGYLADCAGCPLDTLFAGLKAVTLEPGSMPVAVPGTEFASGLSAGGNEDEIYYTVGGDSRVFRRTLSTGEVGVVHDFGAAGIVRDVHVVGNRMAAVVGGRVAFTANPVLGPTQRDSGGVVHVVDLTTGGDQPLDDPGFLFRRPALSPLGDRVVAEGYGLVTFDNGTIADTTVEKSGDLYLFSAP